MVTKLFLILLLQRLASSFDPGYFLIASNPTSWSYLSGFCGGARMISATDYTQRVTNIELGLDISGAIFNFRVLSPGVTLSPQPDCGCNSLTGRKEIFTLAAYQRVVRLDTWRASDGKMYKIKVYLNDGSILEYNPSRSVSTDTLHTFPVAAGQELAGFYPMGDSVTQCVLSSLYIVTRQSTVCAVGLGLGLVDGHSQSVNLDAAKSIAFTVSPNQYCQNASFEYQVSYSPSSATQNLITLKQITPPTIFFNFSIDPADAQVYTITLKARSIGTIDWLAPNGTAFATYTYTKDPCLGTTIIAPTVTDLTTSVLVQSTIGGNPLYVTQTANASDSVSQQQSTECFCGEYVYSISISKISATAALSALEVTIDAATGLVSVYTANSATIGTHTATITCQLASYTSIAAATATFQITISPCVVTSYSCVLQSNQSYNIGDVLLVWPVKASTFGVQIPSCGYQQSLASQSVPSFIELGYKVFLSSFSVYSNNVLDAGSYPITMTSDLINYAYPLSTPTCQQTFYVNVVDPCLETTITITPTLNESIVVFAGYSATSKSKYFAQDTVSLNSDQNEVGTDFCGEKQFEFTMNGTQTTFISAKNSDFIYLSPPIDTEELGTGIATVVASMKNYPSIKSTPIRFNVTILGSVIPSIRDQLYYLGQAKPLQIEFESFKVLPSNYDPGPSSVQAYIFTSDSLPEYIDPNCTCLKNISDSSWLAFDATNDTFIVSTNDSTNIGEHQIILLQSFDQISGMHSYSAFKIRILSAEVLETIEKPPYFENPLTSQTISQCQNSKNDFWSYTLPGIIDPNQSSVSLDVELDQEFFTFDNKLNKITQTGTIIASVNQTVKLTLRNELNLTSVFSMQLSFLCPSHNITSNFTNPKQKISQSKVKLPNPVRIASISRDGIVDIRFQLPVSIYDFVIEPKSGRQLDSNQTSTEDLSKINKNVLKVQRVTRFHTEDLDWHCIEFVGQSLKLQLNFIDPMEISQVHQDQLQVTFDRTDLFVVASQNEYLFSNESRKTISYTIPTQIPSQSSKKVFSSIADSVKQVGMTVIVITLLVQFVAKKVLTYVWLYYCALQIVILLVQHYNTSVPSSVEIMIESISGIINLSSLDKEMIASKLHIDAITNSEVYQTIDGVALSAIGIFLVVLVLLLAIALARKSPKVLQYFLKVKNMIFWNFVIRYFQASFIGFNIAAFIVIQKPTGQFKDIATSMFILVLQYCVVVLVAAVLIRKNHEELNKGLVKKRIGNLYLGLDTRVKQKVIYALAFYVQRCLLVILLAFVPDFGLQWQLCQTVLLLNTAYFMWSNPYLDQTQALLDLTNCVFLMTFGAIISTCSAWNTDSMVKFFYGIGFDVIVCLHFIFNIAIVMSRLGSVAILKGKQLRFRIKERQRQSIKHRHSKPIKTVIEEAHQKADDDIQTKPSTNPRTRKEKQKASKNSQQATQRIQLQSNLQNNLDSISEISDNLSSSCDEKVTAQKNRWRPPTPLPRSSSQDVQETKKSNTSVLSKNSQPIESTESNISACLQKEKSKTLQQSKSTTAQKSGIESYVKSLTQLQKQSFTENTQTPALVTFLQWKVSPALFRFDVPAHKSVQTLKSVERQYLEQAAAAYFAAQYVNVRCYKQLEKYFYWEDDVWLFYRQKVEQNYSGPVVSEEQHREHVKIHLYKQWLIEYPRMPYLPLLVSVELYFQVCQEIKPYVLQHSIQRKRQQR